MLDDIDGGRELKHSANRKKPRGTKRFAFPIVLDFYQQGVQIIRRRAFLGAVSLIIG
jgi:hypothetical protein